MKHVAINDLVLSRQNGALKYSQVTSFLHRLPEIRGEFHDVITSDGNRLTLTPKHLLYVTLCNDTEIQFQRLRRAENVSPGECIVRITSDLKELFVAKVENNTVIMKTGAYAPMTENGIIFVNNVMASCHSIFEGDENVMVFLIYYLQRFVDFIDYVFGGFGLFGEVKNLTELDIPWLFQCAWHNVEKLILL